MNEMDRFIKMVEESGNIVFFGGAGVSTESGIPDFRSTDGLYSQKFDFPPETILSRNFFTSHTKDFYRFYREKMLISGVVPNRAHKALASLEEKGKVRAVITQNIDGLHQLAGSREVLELHGSVLRNYCMSCGRFFDEAYVKESEEIPLCTCGGTIKPDVVLYGESLNDQVIQKAVEYIREADVLIVGGTSLVVYPAAGLIDYYRGRKLVLINRDSTHMDDRADLVIKENIGNAFSHFI